MPNFCVILDGLLPESEYPVRHWSADLLFPGNAGLPMRVFGEKGSAKLLDGFEWEKWIALPGSVWNAV
jgi:hypothetical protein